jgi:hypothetical protein
VTRTAHPGVRRLWLACAFLAVNVWICWLAFAGPGFALGDVSLYGWWVGLGLEGGPWVGIDTSWVYPVLALVPMLLASIGGGDTYVVGWLVLVVVLNVLAMLAVVGVRGPSRSLVAGWWWTAFLLALGPIAVGRIDSITVPIAVIALTLVARRPFIAGVLLAVATWMKVWPAALIAAIVIASKGRWSVVLGGVVTSAAVVVTTVLLGGGGALFSFITMQGDRGLQIESPASAPWRWAAVAGDARSGIYYDDEILTYQVFGPGADIVARVMTPLLAVAVLSIAVFAVWLLGRGVRPASLLPPLALALVTALIVVNKVGSPQFITWLAPVVVFGLIAARSGGPSFRVPAIMVLVIALLTQVVYPVLYGSLLGLEPVMVAVLDARNILLIALLVVALRMMAKTPRSRGRR